jgi:enoyl-CoA hydratase
VSKLARQVATLAPLTLTAIKEGARQCEPGVRLAGGEDLLLSCYLSRDFQEGVRAFPDKRPASWEGG